MKSSSDCNKYPFQNCKEVHDIVCIGKLTQVAEEISITHTGAKRREEGKEKTKALDT